VREITSAVTSLKENLAIAQIQMQALEEKAKGLESENAKKAAEFHKQSASMKVFVEMQQKMVQELQNVLGENKNHLDVMMNRTDECGNDVSGQLEAIKKYVQTNFKAIKSNLNTAAAALKEMTGGMDGNTLDPETITQAQEKVTKAITANVVKLGTMHEYIIESLTAAQEVLSEYKNEMKTKVIQANKAFRDCSDKLMQLNHEAYRMEERIDELAQQKERAERYL
jgi:chromosome segregation ATPase